MRKKAEAEASAASSSVDAAYSGSSIDSLDEADQSQELTYVDIDTSLASF